MYESLQASCDSHRRWPLRSSSCYSPRLCRALGGRLSKPALRLISAHPRPYTGAASSGTSPPVDSSTPYDCKYLYLHLSSLYITLFFCVNTYRFIYSIFYLNQTTNIYVQTIWSINIYSHSRPWILLKVWDQECITLNDLSWQWK